MAEDSLRRLNSELQQRVTSLFHPMDVSMGASFPFRRFVKSVVKTEIAKSVANQHAANAVDSLWRSGH